MKRVTGCSQTLLGLTEDLTTSGLECGQSTARPTHCNMSSQCLVCNLTTLKLGKHYGAVSCYPCRAFFRRAKKRVRQMKCKTAGNCELNGQLKKFCPSCRYDKCLQVGMRPENVLDEADISQRFKYMRNHRHHHNAQNPSAVPDSSSEDQEISGFSGSTEIVTRDHHSMEPLLRPNVQFERVPVIIRNPLVTNHIVSDVTPNNPVLEVGILQTDDCERGFDRDDTDSLICHYVHKKFRKLSKSTEASEEPVSVLNIYHNYHMNTENLQLKDSEFLREMNQVFTAGFSAVNLGEDVMVSYIEFCIKKTHGDAELKLDPSFYYHCNLQITKKFLNFVCLFDFINLPSSKLYKILKTNLPNVKSLFYVFQYNNTSVEEELKLGMVQNNSKGTKSTDHMRHANPLGIDILC